MTMRPRPPRSVSRSRARAPLARYSNYFEVGHNAYECLIDFGQYQPDARDVVLHTRIAVSPALAKLLRDMLRGTVSKYEAEHGALPSLSDSRDALESLLRAMPDFESRAVRARRGSPGKPSPTSPKRPTQKR